MANPENIWLEAQRSLERGKPFALATVINVRGSTPREVGAKMLVRDDGQVGTIGGGCGEAEVFRKARLLLEEGSGARMAEVDLTGDFDQEEIGTCGGIMDVFIDRWEPGRDLPVVQRMAEAVRKSQPLALITMIEPTAPQEPVRSIIAPDEAPGLPLEIAPESVRQLEDLTRRALPGLLDIGQDGKLTATYRTSEEHAQLFVDPLPGAQRLVIAGAGHVGQALCRVAALLGFHVTVIDDRAQFANFERFPEATDVIVRSFEKAIGALKLDRNCYVVAVTRGHSYDEIVLRETLKQEPGPGYLGMIGSRRRVKATLERLERDGFNPARLEQIHAPIGLDIGAETPEEIAISVMAEIVRERRLGTRDASSMGVKLGRLKPALSRAS
ncbi:MAG TPA: XdhC/CoxI family protein [Candidatus Binataceae bacterium]|nr:XdhC/CoxI family protein [Candidatus Binataceae bacterium]